MCFINETYVMTGACVLHFSGRWITDKKEPLIEDIRRAFYDAVNETNTVILEEPEHMDTSNGEDSGGQDMEDDVPPVISQGVYKCAGIWECGVRCAVLLYTNTLTRNES